MSLAEIAAPKTSRGDLRRQAILDIARETFLREGYAAASMSAIGARAGGSKATLYTYFPSKADLFAAVMADMCGRTRLEVAAEAEGGGDLESMLTRLGCAFIRILLSDDVITLHRLVVAESQRFPELGQALYEVGPQLGKATMAEHLQAFIDAGAMRPCDPLHAAGQFFELCLSGLYRRRLWNIAEPITEADRRRNVDSAVAVFLHGYAAA